MIAEELMTPKPEYVGPGSTIREVVEKMLELDIRHLPVVENHALVGIISDRDVRSFVLPLSAVVNDPQAREAQLDRQVHEIMHTDVVSVEAGTDVSTVIELMLENKISAIPVVDSEGNWLKGIISYVDIIKAAQEFFESHG